MIRAVYDRRELSLRLSGHAMSAPRGEDLVCAAASILAFTAEAALEDEAERFFPRVIKKSGELSILCEPAAGARKACRRLLDTLWYGFELLAREYPAYVRAQKED